MSSWLQNSGFNRGSSRIPSIPSYDINEQSYNQPVQNIVVNNTPEVQPVQTTPTTISHDDIKDIVREGFFELFSTFLLRNKINVQNIVKEIIPKEHTAPLSKDNITTIVKEVLFESFNELLLRDKSTIHTIVNDIIPKEQPLQPAPLSKEDITVIVKELIIEMTPEVATVVVPVIASTETIIVPTKKYPKNAVITPKETPTD